MNNNKIIGFPHPPQKYGGPGSFQSRLETALKEEGWQVVYADDEILPDAVLVVGGSLGAQTINDAITKNICMFKEREVNLIWQTGVSFQEQAKSYISQLSIDGVNIYTFIKEMDLAYAAADIIISRAGAIAISELCCVGKPVILVPSPNVSENHQYKNAQSLVNKNAALLVEDSLASRKLVTTLMKLLEDKNLQVLLSSNIKKLAVKDAADRIAAIGLDLIK